MSTPSTPSTGPDRKRYLRNYLLDARFQLKFTGYNIAIAVCVSAILGAFLWSTSKRLLEEAEVAVEARQKAVETSKELSNSALSNKVAEHFNDPGFEAQLKAESAKIDQGYEAEKNAIVQQRAELLKRQETVWLVLVGCMLAFVAFIGMATIVATHHIVGPLFRIKRLVGEVASGRLKVPEYPLRDGDELKDVFDGLTKMVQGLRDRHTEDAQALATMIERVQRSKAAMELVPDLQALEQRMLNRLK